MQKDLTIMDEREREAKYYELALRSTSGDDEEEMLNKEFFEYANECEIRYNSGIHYNRSHFTSFPAGVSHNGKSVLEPDSKLAFKTYLFVVRLS